MGMLTVRLMPIGNWSTRASSRLLRRSAIGLRKGQPPNNGFTLCLTASGRGATTLSSSGRLAGFPSTYTQFSLLEEALGSRPLLYWEGDAWGSRKPMTQQMKWWCRRSDIVFSIGGPPLADLYLGAGAKRVLHTVHTYCHLKFADAEKHAPSLVTGSEVVVISSNLSRIPHLTGLPGSAERRHLIWRLRRDQNLTLRLFGPGWPKGWSSGRIDFARQTDELRKGQLSANWIITPHFLTTAATDWQSVSSRVDHT